MTMPMDRWVTDPHLYLGVVTDDLTRTLSPMWISVDDGELLDNVVGCTNPMISTWM